MPKYDLTVNRPNRPKGDDIEVPPFGIFKNGEPKTVAMPDEMADRYRDDPNYEIKHLSDEATSADGWMEDIRLQEEVGLAPEKDAAGEAAEERPSVTTPLVTEADEDEEEDDYDDEEGE